MAIITPGQMAAAASGSVGGTVFSRNRGGAYVRNRSVPSNPNTTAQQVARANLAARSQEWQALTAAQREAWTEWARQHPITNALGAQILMSGAQAYSRLNTRINTAGGTLITVPPTADPPDALLTIALAADIGAGDVDITYTATPLAAAEHLWVRSAVVTSPGITYITNLLRFTVVSSAAQASPLDIESAVAAIWGTLQVGQTLHVEAGVFDSSSGLLSPLRRDSAVISTT